MDEREYVMTPLEAVRRAIMLKMQLKDFGHSEVDENGEEVFVMQPGNMNDFVDAVKEAARAALVALSNVKLSDDDAGLAFQEICRRISGEKFDD